MSRFMFLFVFWFPMHLIASDTTDIALPIRSVKLFSSHAQIHRQASVNIPRSTTVLRIRGLSHVLDYNSVRFKSSRDVEILSVKPMRDFMQKNVSSGRHRQLKKQKALLRKDLNTTDARHKALKHKIDILEANDRLSGEQRNATIGELKEHADYASQELELIYNEQYDLKIRKDSILAKIAKINDELGSAKRPSREPRPTQVLVEIANQGAEDVELTLEYLVSNCSWYSEYDLRLDDLSQPINLRHKAIVRQNTGEDWKDVQMALSTADVKREASVPKLFPWRLYPGAYSSARRNAYRNEYQNRPYDPTVRRVRGRITDYNGESLIAATVEIVGLNKGTSTDVNGYYELEIPQGIRELEVTYLGYQTLRVPIFSNVMDLRLNDSGILLEEVAIIESRSKNTDYYVDGERVSGANNEQTIIGNRELRSTSIEYVLDRSFTILSDGKEKNITIEEIDIPADYVYHAVPKLDADAFLVAEIIDYAQYDLPSGKSSLYFEGGYVGQSYLDFQDITQDTMDVSLGRDPSVIIKREKVDIKNKTTWLNNKRVSRRVWEISVVNKKDRAIVLKLADQVPVSTEKDIEVSYEAKDATVDTETGRVEWILDMESQSRETKRLSYELRYPKKYRIYLE